MVWPGSSASRRHDEEDGVKVDIGRLKQQAAENAVDYVRPGMVVGLGYGSTALLAVRRIGHLLRSGELRDVTGVPCARGVEEEARRLGIPLTTLEEHPVIDLTIDGADEVSPTLDMIKGAGGAMLHEKIVAQASRREIIVVDERKLVPTLGTRAPVPVEVLPFGWKSQMSYLESIGARAVLRSDGDRPFRTDEGNFILDCEFGPITDPPSLAARIKGRGGIVEHGMFLGLATDVIVARESGIEHLRRDGVRQ
jgi:ribose 5-phosphate isomerase A